MNKMQEANVNLKAVHDHTTKLTDVFWSHFKNIRVCRLHIWKQRFFQRSIFLPYRVSYLFSEVMFLFYTRKGLFAHATTFTKHEKTWIKCYFIVLKRHKYSIWHYFTQFYGWGWHVVQCMGKCRVPCWIPAVCWFDLPCLTVLCKYDQGHQDLSDTSSDNMFYWM